MIAISLVEDNHYLRQGWRSLLEVQDDFIVLADYENCESAFSEELIGQSDVVLMDIGLPGMSGVEGVAWLLERYPKLNIIMCSVFDDDDHIFDAICAGAVGYLLKKTPPQELVSAIREAVNGGSPMTARIARRVIRSFHKPAAKKPGSDLDALTAREQQVLEKLAEGHSYAGIGEDLSISLNSVRSYIRQIYDKLQVHSKTEAVSKGLKQKIIRPPR